MDALRKGLLRVLGGGADANGDAFDRWVEVFEGTPEDAEVVRVALSDAGINCRSRVYTPARFYGWPEPARSVISVPISAESASTILLAQLPHLGNSLATATGEFRPSGALSLAEFETRAEAEMARQALHAYEIKSYLRNPYTSPLGDSGFVLSVRGDEVQTAAEILRQVQAENQTGSFRPIDLPDAPIGSPPALPDPRHRGRARTPMAGWFLLLPLSILGLLLLALTTTFASAPFTTTQSSVNPVEVPQGRTYYGYDTPTGGTSYDVECNAPITGAFGDDPLCRSQDRQQLLLGVIGAPICAGLLALELGLIRRNRRRRKQAGVRTTITAT